MAQRDFSVECRRTGSSRSIALASRGVGYHSARLVDVYRWTASTRPWAFVAHLGLMLTGCLDPPPTYEERSRIPPFVIAPSVNPDLDKVVSLATNKSLQIRVPFRSEDLGEPLTAVFSFDGTYQGSDVVGPSVFDDDTRAVEFSLRPEVDPGCYQLSMALTHQANLKEGRNVFDESMAAYLFWWVELFDDRVGAMALCPEGSL